MKRNSSTRRTIIVVPFNMDVRQHKQDFVDAFVNGGSDIRYCHLTVATCPEDEARANAFCDEIGKDFETRNVVVCNDAFSHMDCDTKQVCELAAINDKELANARDSYRAGQMARPAMSEAFKRWCATAIDCREKCFKAGVFAAKLFREAIMSLWSWNEETTQAAGFDPHDSYVLLVSEDGTQVPFSPTFFQHLEFEYSKEYTRFVVPYVHDAGDAVRGGNRYTVIGSIFSKMEYMTEVMDGMQISDKYNWREQLTSYFMDSYKVSNVMAKEFRIKKSGESHVSKNDARLSSTSDVNDKNSLVDRGINATNAGELQIGSNGAVSFRDSAASKAENEQKETTTQSTVIKRKRK